MMWVTDDIDQNTKQSVLHVLVVGTLGEVRKNVFNNHEGLPAFE